MNYLRKIKKNAKALSPVVASIILIAVTVAVSVAVAAWMGGLSLGFMSTETATITNVAFDGTNAVNVTVANSGATNITLSSAIVNNAGATINVADTTLGANTASNTVRLTLADDWVSGNSYQIKLVSAKGTSFIYSAVAP